MDRQKTLHHYFGGILPEKENLVERIKEKLTHNDNLNVTERKFLLEFLQNSVESSNVTRQSKNDFNIPKPKMVNKKVQVFPIPAVQGFAQTDRICPAILKAIARKDEIAKKMKELATNKNRYKGEINQLMTSTFHDRRKSILFGDTIADLKQIYPLLFSVEEIKKELDRVFYDGKCIDFLSNIVAYSSCILDKCDQSEEIFIRTMENQMKAKTIEEKQYAKAVGSILALPNLMHEELGFLNLPNDPCQSDEYPYINGSAQFIRDVFSNSHFFEVRCERTLLCKANNFVEAFLCLVASFFIFNFNYPENCQKSLIVCEKLYLDVSDTKEEDIDERTKQFIQILKQQAMAL